jgi:hypothetical protein
MTNNLEVSLVKELCPVCGKEMDGPIIINTVLTEKCAKKVRDLHNKVVGFANHCCEECSKYKDEAVFFVSIDPSKSDNGSLEGLYRTGKISGIKKEAAIIKPFKDYIITIEDGTRIVFIDEETGKNLGVFRDA